MSDIIIGKSKQRPQMIQLKGENTELVKFVRVTFEMCKYPPVVKRLWKTDSANIFFKKLVS